MSATNDPELDPQPSEHRPQTEPEVKRSGAELVRDARPEAGPHRALVAALLALAGVAALAAIWIVDYLPTHDGPQHVFLGHLENHVGDPGAGYDRYLTRGQPWTALGFDVIFSLIERFAPWRAALRLTLSLIALVWGAGHVALAAAIDRRRAALGLVGFATAISWPLYMGFFSFTLSMGLALWTLAILAGAWPWTPKRRAAIAALLLVQAIAHPFGAVIAGLAVVATALLAPGLSPRDRARELGLSALMGAPAALLALTAAGSETSNTEWLSIAERFTVLPRAFAPGPSWRAYPPLLLGLLGVVITASRARRGEASAAERGLAATSAICFALGFLAPLHLPSWEFFAPRFLPAACLLGAALLPIERLDPRRSIAAIAGLGALALSAEAWAISTSMSLRARVDEALSGMDAPLRREGPRLAVIFDPSAGLTPFRQKDGREQAIPFHAPLFNLGALYAVAQGGVPPYVFTTNPKIHPFVLSAEGRKRYPELYDPSDLADPKLAADPEFRRGFLTFLAALGAGFEDVILYGKPEDGDLFVARGYEVDARRGGLFVGRFSGCPLTVEIKTPAPRVPAMFVELGADPMPQAIDRLVIPPEKSEKSEKSGDAKPEGESAIATSIARYRPKLSLCGASWLRVTLDADLSGQPSPGDRSCAGADPKGRVRFEAKRGQTIGCTIAP